MDSINLTAEERLWRSAVVLFAIYRLPRATIRSGCSLGIGRPAHHALSPTRICASAAHVHHPSPTYPHARQGAHVVPRNLARPRNLAQAVCTMAEREATCGYQPVAVPRRATRNPLTRLWTGGGPAIRISVPYWADSRPAKATFTAPVSLVCI